MIDLGFYANLRKLQGRFNEYNITDREEVRNAPVMSVTTLLQEFERTPAIGEDDLLRKLAADNEEASYD